MIERRVERRSWRALRWTEWLELGWRMLMTLALIWLVLILRDLAELRSKDVDTAAWAWATNAKDNAETNRYLRMICLNSVTVYDAARGVCDSGAVVEIRPPIQVPKLKGGAYQKGKP